MLIAYLETSLGLLMSNMRKILPYTCYKCTKLCPNQNVDSQINHLCTIPNYIFTFLSKEIEGKKTKNVAFTLPHCIFAEELLLGGF